MTPALPRPPEADGTLRRRVLSLLLPALLATACDPPSPPRASAPPPGPVAPVPPVATAAPASGTRPDLQQAGARIVASAFSLLSSNLLGALGRTGPPGALEFCSVNVAPLTAEAAKAAGGHQVEIRRVTHQPRNPANRASEAELRLIEEYRAGLAVGRTNPPVLVTHADGVATFYSPILLANPLCLQCHGQPGSEIAEATLAVIDRLYPADEARGFRLNELRGLWVVRFEPAPGATAAPVELPPLPGGTR